MGAHSDTPSAGTDRRVRKTKKALRECLIRLLQTKKLQDITVREISEMADINRGTFYLHYKDVYDLAEQIENEFARDFEEILLHYDSGELTEHPSYLFRELYPFVKENAPLISALMGTNGNLQFENRVRRIIRERALMHWAKNRYAGDESSIDAFLAYIVSGCIGLVTYWINNGMKESPDHMAELTESFITRGIHVLQG